MTTATSLDPTGSTMLDSGAQALIDSRLDTIERLLLGQVPRADRLAIVREVEAQLHDLLGERNPADTDRDAVLAALSRLDPPEAYLPDEAGELAPLHSPSRSRSVSTARGPRSDGSARPIPMIGKAAGILGIVAIGAGLPATIALALDLLVLETEYVMLGSAAILLITGVISLQAIIFAACAKLHGTWPLIGFTTGVITLLLSTLGVGYTGFLFLGN